MPIHDAVELDGRKNDSTGTASPSVWRRDPILVSSFMVSFEGLNADLGGTETDTVGFSSISGIGSQIKTEESVIGSEPISIAVPTGISYSPASFKRGVTTERMAMGLLQWFNAIKELLGGYPSRDATRLARYGEGAGSSLSPQMKKRAITIKLPQNPRAIPLENSNTVRVPLLYIILRDAWPSKFSLGELDASARGVLIYELEMQYGGIDIRDHP
jgi:phage tail-like protein